MKDLNYNFMLRYNEIKEVLPEDMQETKYKISCSPDEITKVQTLSNNDYDLEITKYNSLLEHLNKLDELQLLEKEEMKERLKDNEETDIPLDEDKYIIERVHDIYYDSNNYLSPSLLAKGSIDSSITRKLSDENCRNTSMTSETIVNGLYTSYINPNNIADISYAESKANMSFNSLDMKSDFIPKSKSINNSTSTFKMKGKSVKPLCNYLY